MGYWPVHLSPVNTSITWSRYWLIEVLIMQAGTRFTYPGGMEGWVYLVTRKRSRRESNSRPLGPESNALTTEPQSVLGPECPVTHILRCTDVFARCDVVWCGVALLSGSALRRRLRRVVRSDVALKSTHRHPRRPSRPTSGPWSPSVHRRRRPGYCCSPPPPTPPPARYDTIRYDTIDDSHWKTDRQAASLI